MLTINQSKILTGVLKSSYTITAFYGGRSRSLTASIVGWAKKISRNESSYRLGMSWETVKKHERLKEFRLTMIFYEGLSLGYDFRQWILMYSSCKPYSRSLLIEFGVSYPGWQLEFIELFFRKISSTELTIEMLSMKLFFYVLVLSHL